MNEFYFAETLKVENPRLAQMGAILIDVDQDNGCAQQTDRLSFDATVKDSCLLFPLGMSMNEEAKDNGLLFMRGWFNGFSYTGMNSNVLDMRNIKPSLSKWVNSRGVCSSDQMFANRSPQMMNTMFSCFKRYNSEMRLAPASSFVEDRFVPLRNMGGLIDDWHKTPLSIRYALSARKSKHKLDYLFLIGGSDLILDVEEFEKKREQIAHSLLKCNEAIVADPKSYAKYEKEIRDFKVWKSFATTELAKEPNQELIKVARSKRTCIRFMTGIAYIYNYLMYAREVLGTESFDVLEINGNDVTEIQIDQILDLYEPTYKYFRNIAFMTNLA